MNVKNGSFGGGVLNKHIIKNKNKLKSNDNECDERLFVGGPEESWIGKTIINEKIIEK
jgi:hypothetical protein